MDTRRLDAFLKVVDLGSVTRAAKILNIAQPALSQQIAALEGEFKRPLLIRSPRGVLPTEAGRILYRYAQRIQRQLDEARNSILESERELTGNVAVGLAPLSSAMLLAGPLLAQTRRQFPGIVLQIFDNFGVTLSELMLKGRLDMAVLYGTNPVEGLDYKRLHDESFVVVGPAGWSGFRDEAGPVSAAELATLDLLLPTRESFLRQTIDRVCVQAGLAARVVAEVQSVTTLASALSGGLGLTVLPERVAASLPAFRDLPQRTIDPALASLQVSIGISTLSPLSDAAFAVYSILRKLTAHQEGDAAAMSDPTS